MKDALVRAGLATLVAAVSAMLIAPQAHASERPRILADTMLGKFPESPPASCAEFSRAIRTFSGIAASVVSAGDDELTGCAAVIDSVRSVVHATSLELQPFFAPVWSSTALCALRFDRWTDAAADLEQGVIALRAMHPFVVEFMDDPEAGVEGLSPEDHCLLVVTLMSSVAGTRSLLAVANRLVDEAATGSDVSKVRRLRDDLAARDEYLLPVEEQIAELFE